MRRETHLRWSLSEHHALACMWAVHRLRGMRLFSNFLTYISVVEPLLINKQEFQVDLHLKSQLQYSYFKASLITCYCQNFIDLTIAYRLIVIDTWS